MFVVLGQFEENRPDQQINCVKGNVAVIPCGTIKSIPPAVMEFEFNGYKLQNSRKLNIIAFYTFHRDLSEIYCKIVHLERSGVA